MKARPEDQIALLTLQECDNHLTQLTHQLSSIPARAELELVSASLRDFSQVLVAKSGILEDAQRELTRLEDDVRVVRERQARDTERLNASSSVKDIAGLEAELSSLATRLNNLEEAELVVMQQVEDATAEVATAQADRDEADERRAALATTVEAAAAALNSELEAERVRRHGLAAAIPQDLLDLYERQRARYGVGAALLTRGISGGSGLRLTESDLEKIRRTPADDVVLCPDSSCILVRTEESGL
jgi:predicted  nucleic acid-binding Zn-ribbon protein